MSNINKQLLDLSLLLYEDWLAKQSGNRKTLYNQNVEFNADQVPSSKMQLKQMYNT